MDNLALNIFVPEDRKSISKTKLPKPKRSLPTQTVVRGSNPVKGKTPKVVGKGSKSEKPAKKVSFVKTKTSKSTPSAEPFLVSRQFNKSIKNDVDDEKPFTVSFVKPKLFQKKPPLLNRATPGRESSKLGNGDEEKKILNTSNNNSPENFNGVNEVTSSGKQQPKKASKSGSSGSQPGEKIVEFSNSAKIGHEKPKPRSKHETKRKDVFVAQTFTKWMINPEVADGKVRIDFPTSGANVGPKPTSNEKNGNMKRKIKHDEDVLPVDRKKIKIGNGGDDAGLNKKKGGNLILERESSSSVANADKKKFESHHPVELRQSGPISSLFNSAPQVEKLEELDVEPLEEKLFSRKPFADIGVHPHLVGNLEQLFGITKMTMVQKKTIPVLMSGKDGLVRSQTGSGKTLAYAIPIMHCLAEITPKLTRKDGVKALIVLPTRELALQTYECFTKLMRAFTWIVPGIVVGGEKRKSEKVRLRKGITVLIGTPGRLLDHAEHTDSLTLHGIDWLIIDEADKLLEMGYEKDISNLMSVIDGQRQKSDQVGRKQTVLLSATLTSGVERLANLALKDPVRIDACGESVLEDVLVIPNTLEQKYIVVPAKMRLVALASILIDVAELKKSNKMLVFMATQDMVDFYLELLQGVLSSSVKFYKLHGNMSQTDRTEVFNRFRSSDKGVLLSTDVAARGLDLPKVDWIVQFTAPTTPSEYVHRVGRTARVGTTGSAVLFLLPSELHFVSMLSSSRIKLGEGSLDQYLKSLMKIHLESKDGQRWGGGVEGAATVLQHNFEHSILEDSALHELACKAYKSWVRFYATYPKDLRVVFDFKSLHLGHNAKSFALRDPPRAIGGIGKPKKGDKFNKSGVKIRKDDRRKRKPESLGHVTTGSRTKKLILSEFDSGLRPVRKT